VSTDELSDKDKRRSKWADPLAMVGKDINVPLFVDPAAVVK
jgi:hypothetical protein